VGARPPKTAGLAMASSSPEYAGTRAGELTALECLALECLALECLKRANLVWTGLEGSRVRSIGSCCCLSHIETWGTTKLREGKKRAFFPSRAKCIHLFERITGLYRYLRGLSLSQA
jgi:hypothetical protein